MGLAIRGREKEQRVRKMAKDIILEINGFAFVFDDKGLYEVKASSFKEAIRQTAKYTGCDSDVFLKSLNGFEETDTNGIIELFNHFSPSAISKFYGTYEDDDVRKDDEQ